MAMRALCLEVADISAEITDEHALASSTSAAAATAAAITASTTASARVVEAVAVAGPCSGCVAASTPASAPATALTSLGAFSPAAARQRPLGRAREQPQQGQRAEQQVLEADHRLFGKMRMVQSRAAVVDEMAVWVTVAPGLMIWTCWLVSSPIG